MTKITLSRAMILFLLSLQISAFVPAYANDAGASGGGIRHCIASVARRFGLDPLEKLFGETKARTLSPEDVALLESSPIEEISIDDLVKNPNSPLVQTIQEKIIRAMDIGHATVAIPFAVPVVGFFALMIQRTSKGPVFYIAKRIGKDGKIIEVPKLRTMRMDADKSSVLGTQAGDSRVAGPWAARARRFKVDELPQLLSVLRGDLSVVGPRPLDVREVTAIEENLPGFTKLRHARKPGLADAAQATHPHSGDPKTPEGQALRKEKYYAELQGAKNAAENPIRDYYESIGLVIQAILTGTGAR